MEAFVLIDNTNLKKLVSAVEIDWNLKALHSLFQTGKIKLLVPVALRIEWNKHREYEKNRIRGALKRISIREGVSLSDEEDHRQKEKLRASENLLFLQVDMIDEMMEKGIQLTESDKASLQIYRHHDNKLAPFHTDKDAWSDAKICFTSLDWLTEGKSESLFFLSDNHNQFGSPLNPKSELHPDISSVYSKVSVQYCTEAKILLQLLREAGIHPPAQGRHKIHNYIYIDRSLSLHRQIVEFFDKKFCELSILPDHLYVYEYPFIIGQQRLHAAPGTITTDHRALFDYFDEEPADLNEDEKIERLHVIRRLQRNHIGEIRMLLSPGKEMVATLKSDATTNDLCKCYTCLYRRLDFFSLLKLLQNPPADESIVYRLRRGYAFYKLGYMREAIELYKGLVAEKDSHSAILNYLLQFNLAVLGHALYRADNATTAQYQEELDAIDIDEQYELYRTREHRPLVDWFHDYRFYREWQRKIVSHNFKIRELQVSQSTGRNDVTSELIVDYFHLSEAAMQNGILIDISGVFDTVTNAYVEGLFLSYTCQPRLGGKLVYFSTGVTEKLLLEASDEVIRKYAIRNKIKSVVYKESMQEGLRFIDRLQNLFNNVEQIESAISTHTTPFSFWRNFERIVLTAITLLSLFESTDSELDETTELITQFLREENHLHHYKLNKAIIYFLSKKRSQMSSSALLKWLALCIEKASLQSADIFDTLFEAFEIQGMKVVLSDEQFEKVKSFFEDATEESARESWKIFAEMHRILENVDQRSYIERFMNERLKDAFEGEDFYYASIMNVVEPDPSFMEAFSNEIFSIIEKGQTPRMEMGQTFYSDYRVDSYLNLCLKYGIPIHENIRLTLPTLSDYYQWLLTPDSFDYTKFNPDWLHHYFTRYYKRYFRQSAKLKEHVLSMISDDPENKELLQFYLFTYEIPDKHETE